MAAIPQLSIWSKMIMSEQKHAPSAHVSPLFHQIPEVCRLLGVGRSSIYELIASGRLASVAIGRRRLIAAAEIERFAAELTRGQHG
jgi:excisionase family DNA binding protein